MSAVAEAIQASKIKDPFPKFQGEKALYRVRQGRSFRPRPDQEAVTFGPGKCIYLPPEFVEELASHLVEPIDMDGNVLDQPKVAKKKAAKKAKKKATKKKASRRPTGAADPNADARAAKRTAARKKTAKKKVAVRKKKG